MVFVGLRRHTLTLLTAWPSTFRDITSQSGGGLEDSSTPSVSSLFPKLEQLKQPKYPSNHPKQKQGRKLLVQWICRSHRPINIVEDKTFVALLELLNPQFTVPCRMTVARDIEELYKVKYAEMVNELKSVRFSWGTNDAGSTLDSRSFIDMNIHSVDQNFEPRKDTIAVLEMKESKNAINYRAKVDSVEEEAGVKGKVIGYTTDNEATMHKAFENDTRNGCFAHIQSKSSQRTLDSQETLKKLRKKLRKVARRQNKTHKFKLKLTENQVKRGLQPKSIKQEVKTRFTSTHTLFRSILNDPNYGKSDKPDEEKIAENIAAINESMDEAKVKAREKLKITEDDVEVMLQLVPVLDTLEEATTLLGGENYSTGSVVLPFERKIMKVLQILLLLLLLLLFHVPAAIAPASHHDNAPSAQSPPHTVPSAQSPLPTAPSVQSPPSTVPTARTPIAPSAPPPNCFQSPTP